MLAAKENDQIVAVDTHIVMVPSPGGPDLALDLHWVCAEGRVATAAALPAPEGAALVR